MIKNCLLPVAGFGTRFFPVTKVIPKEMLPVLTKPLIQYAIEEAIEAKIYSFSLVTNKYKESIKSYFKPHEEIENLLKKSSKNFLLNDLNSIMDLAEFKYILQDEMLGLGHAIKIGNSIIDTSPFAVILPDDLCVNLDGKSVLSQMVELHEKYPEYCIVGIEEVPITQVSSYGVIDGQVIDNNGLIYSVKNMVEKPNIEDAPTNLAIIGRYILTREIFDVLEITTEGKNGEIQITDALMELAKKGKVLAYKFQGVRFDCGTVDGYIKANNFFLRNSSI